MDNNTLLCSLARIGEEVRAAVGAGYFEQARTLLDSYVHVVSASRTNPLDIATVERDWNELDRWLRTTVECWREEARAQIGRLGSLKQYTCADRRASIFSLNG
jgi:hypothetical protein